MLLLIDNYDSFTYNLVHYLGELGASCEVFRNDKITVDDALALKPRAIVLSPGPCTPNEAGICLDLVTRANGAIPMLGVCLGHQTIAQAYGSTIVRANLPMHGKLSSIAHNNVGIFENLPNPLSITRYHSLVVDKQSVSDSLEITAQTKDGIIMGLQHRNHPVYGVQFHPESIASQSGHALLGNFLRSAGFNVAAPPPPSVLSQPATAPSNTPTSSHL